MKGEVVGINSQIYSRTGGFMGLSFAIPIDVAMDVQGQLKAGGRVQRGRIGVVIQEVSRELADSFKLGFRKDHTIRTGNRTTKCQSTRRSQGRFPSSRNGWAWRWQPSGSRPSPALRR